MLRVGGRLRTVAVGEDRRLRLLRCCGDAGVVCGDDRLGSEWALDTTAGTESEGLSGTCVLERGVRLKLEGGVGGSCGEK